MRALLAITERELRAYFLSPVGYVILFVFLFLAAIFFYIPLAAGEASLRYFFSNVVIWLIILVPALTMRLIADERRTGTLEVLMTSPVTDGQVILGKFLGSLGFYAVMLLATLEFPLALRWAATPDRGPIVTGYIGLALFGASFLSIGLLASCLTKSQVVAFMTTVMTLLLLVLVDWFASVSTGSLNTVLQFVGMRQHLENFSKGIIDTKDVIYYLSVIGLCLLLSVRALAAWKWR
jgi:ABC-2 type transport system permease protein